MSLSLSTIYGVKIDSTLLGGITQQASATGTRLENEVSSGAVYPAIQTINGQNPTVSWTTRAIATALGAVGLTGSNIADLTNKLTIYAQALDHGGTRASGSAHRTIVVNDGLIIPRTLSVDHQGSATLSYDTIVTYNGTNDPFVIADSAALAGTLTDTERYTIGEVTTLESLTIAQITSLNLDFGIEARAEGADSNIWPQFAGIYSIKPVLTLRGTLVTWLSASFVPLIGKAITHANTTVYLRKRSHGGTFVADETEEHIALTMDGTAYIETPWDGSNGSPAECSLRLECRHDGTNAPITVDTTSAIT